VDVCVCVWEGGGMMIQDGDVPGQAERAGRHRTSQGRIVTIAVDAEGRMEGGGASPTNDKPACNRDREAL